MSTRSRDIFTGAALALALVCVAASATRVKYVGAFVGLDSGVTNSSGSAYLPANGGEGTNVALWGSLGKTNKTWTDAVGWHNTNSGAANQGVDVTKGTLKGFATTNVMILRDTNGGSWRFYIQNNGTMSAVTNTENL